MTGDYQLPPMPADAPLALPPLFNPPAPPPTPTQVAVATAGKAVHFGRPVVGLLLAAVPLSQGVPLWLVGLAIAAGALVRP